MLLVASIHNKRSWWCKTVPLPTTILHIKGGVNSSKCCLYSYLSLQQTPAGAKLSDELKTCLFREWVLPTSRRRSTAVGRRCCHRDRWKYPNTPTSGGRASAPISGTTTDLEPMAYLRASRTIPPRPSTSTTMHSSAATLLHCFHLAAAHGTGATPSAVPHWSNENKWEAQACILCHQLTDTFRYRYRTKNAIGGRELRNGCV